MPLTPARPAALAGRVFRGSAAVHAGLLTRHQLHGATWRRLFADVYAGPAVEVTHELRIRAATSLVLPGAVASGRSAAVLWGVDLAGPEDAVECTVPASSRAGAGAGVRVTRRALPATDVTERRGVAATTPLRTALDLGRIQPLDEAVVAIDRFLRPGLVLLPELRAAALHVRGRDCRRIRAAVALADGRAESPQETRLRLLLHRSPLPAPMAQHPVRHDGHFVARVDFAWPDRRLALEYDGVWHGAPRQFARDRERLNRLTEAGWTVLFVTAADLRDPARLLARIAAALTVPRTA